MPRRSRALAGVLLLLTATPVPAAPDAERASSSLATERTATPLTDSERSRAALWALSEVEWRRYRQLMEGIRGSVSPPTLSPIEVLGIHARDAAERRRYAERWARLMREDAARILAFQRAYDAAQRRLDPDTPLIDVAAVAPPENPPEVLGPGDRVLFFTRPDCSACDAVLTRLLARLPGIAGIDIYLTGLGPGQEAAVRAWAADRALRPEWVEARRVTLNFDAGALARLAPGRLEPPALMRRRGDTIAPLPASALQ